MRALVDTFVSWQYEAPRSKYQLAITLAAEDMLVGNCGIRLPSADAEQGELGYELAPNHWGQGYATEAARAMLDFAFGELDLHRLWASCLAENRGSVRVLERLGLRREGTLLQSQWVKGRWRDTYLYAILQEEHNR